MTNVTDLIAFHEARIAENSCPPSVPKEVSTKATCQSPEVRLPIYEKFCGQQNNIRPKLERVNDTATRNSPNLPIYNRFCSDPHRLDRIFPPRKYTCLKSYTIVYERPKTMKKKKKMTVVKEETVITSGPEIAPKIKNEPKKTIVRSLFRWLFKARNVKVSPSNE